MNALAHFEHLEREKVSLEKDTNRFNQERTQYELRLKEIRDQIKLTEDQNREMSLAVGTLHRETTLRKGELEHLRSTMQRERKELEEHAHAVDMLLSTEREAKKAFCEEMGEMNTDLGNLLVEQEGLYMVELITEDNMQLLQEHLMKQQAAAMTNKAVLEEDGSQIKSNFEEEGIKDTILIQASDAENFATETAQVRLLNERLAELTSKVEQLREMAIQSSSSSQKVTTRSDTRLFANRTMQTTLLTFPSPIHNI